MVPSSPPEGPIQKKGRQADIVPYLQLRGAAIQAVREFFFNRAYLEVETPCRIPAPAPEAHIDAPAAGDWFLRSSPELCMKRLLASGYERIFQICRCFRQGERGDRHLPEFTLLEWYRAGFTYHELMTECENLVVFTARRLGQENNLAFQQRRIPLDAPWRRLTVSEAFDLYTDTTMDRSLRDGRFHECIGYEIEPQLGWDQPTFLYDYPAVEGALARLKKENPHVAERFELYIGGVELCNGFSELTDPKAQRSRFEAERRRRREAGKTVYPMPEAFLKSMETMPPCAGNALGIDRLMMVLADIDQIDAVVAFTPEEL